MGFKSSMKGQAYQDDNNMGGDAKRQVTNELMHHP